VKWGNWWESVEKGLTGAGAIANFPGGPAGRMPLAGKPVGGDSEVSVDPKDSLRTEPVRSREGPDGAGSGGREGWT
jgi:hypothetical protein